MRFYSCTTSTRVFSSNYKTCEKQKEKARDVDNSRVPENEIKTQLL